MKRVLFLVFAILVAGFAKAADLYVPTNYDTIQAAINAANNGDTVWVKDGIYTGANNKNLTWIGKRITVRSVNGANTNGNMGDVFG
jgi:pectin methylesterase-like acyl-CoA thioesterase